MLGIELGSSARAASALTDESSLPVPPLLPDEEDYDPFLEGEEGFFMEDLEDRLEIQLPKESEGNPSWRVWVEYTNHTEQDICSYEDYLPDRPEELYLSLLEYFESEDEVF